MRNLYFLFAFLSICGFAFAVYEQRVTIVCEDRGDVLECPDNHVIMVTSAFYGRRDSSTCGYSSNTNCVADDSYNDIRNHCQNENVCFLIASNNVFGDPCHGVDKYIRVEYYCVPAAHYRFETAFACEHTNPETVSCSNDNDVILVVNGFYGRLDTQRCGYNAESDCIADGSFEEIQRRCHNRNSCQLHATNSIYGDPCRGVEKYVEMHYYCVSRRNYRLQEAIACQHASPITVSCNNENDVIIVENGFYGRQDTNHQCGYNAQTNCVADGSFDEIQRRCQDRNSCQLRATNSIFGDPCWGVRKYVEMHYYCVPRPAYALRRVTACENDVGVTASCPAGYIILVHTGIYGRYNDRRTCPHPSIRSTRCFASNSPDILKRDCNNRNSCLLRPTNSYFGDPCPGTYKYLQIFYYCVPF